jgi:acyl-coenzyme A synthetase/AMP-(fatty) acid ligase
MKHINDIHKGDVYFSGSDIGWVVGHHFIVYGPLLRGKLSIFFDYFKKGILQSYFDLIKLIGREPYYLRSIHFKFTKII